MTNKNMPVRDTFKNFCDVCWVLSTLCAVVCVGITVLGIFAAFAGVYWFLAVGVALCVGWCCIAYLEANDHWKGNK
jgi:hypothetical protein